LVAERNLRYFVHSLGVVRGVNFTAQQDFLRKCGQWGLCLNPYSKYCKDLKEAIDFCLFWQDRKGKLDYQVDGVVVKVNSFTLQEKLGSTHKSPRWAVAYKFPAHQATTRVKKIEFGVGRTGIITPTAILVPVECGGVTISRATLHNFDEIKRLGIKEGDTVLLERAGEVIPKIIKVITSKRTGRERAVKVPVICPVCGSDVEKEKDEEVYWYCLNPDCPAQLKRSLLHFASRGAMDIEGMGAAVIEELVNRNMVKKHSDIYALKKDDFLKLPFFKDKRAKNLVSAIDKSKNRPLSRFLFGLGIKHVGEKAALVLARKFNNIDIFFKLKDSDLERLAEVGPVMASSIVKFFSSRNSRKMIEEFRRAGVNFPPLKPAAKESRITGKSFVFTGELNSLSRSQAKKLVESSGGKWVSAVSKNSDFLVAGKNPGSKYAKAEQLGVNILAEKDFLALLD
jgi:DNA ligase (NAD+)